MNKALKKSFSLTESTTNQGFTLIELLVVIVIIAILFSFSILAIRTDSAEERIKQEARRFNQLLGLALEEAVLKNTEYGIEFKPGMYRFLQYTDNTWAPVSSDKQLRQRELPHDIELELTVEDIDVIIGEPPENQADDETGIEVDDKAEKHKAQVYLLSSEEITPEFSIRFFIPGVENSYNVLGNIDGQHQVKLSEF